jgi:hypothetical protein
LIKLILNGIRFGNLGVLSSKNKQSTVKIKKWTPRKGLCDHYGKPSTMENSMSAGAGLLRVHSGLTRLFNEPHKIGDCAIETNWN